jgi:hypothetical protein
VPLALSAGQPGSEIQAPMAMVILAGLLSSTVLNMIVVPALYLRFGTRGERRSFQGGVSCQCPDNERRLHGLVDEPAGLCSRHAPRYRAPCRGVLSGGPGAA